VENAQIAERLLALEVEYGQGFHLGRPQPFGRAAATPAFVGEARTSAM